MDDMFKEKLSLKQQIDSLEQKLSNQIKEKESLLQTFTVLKNESKEKESKYMDKEIDLEKKIKELDNIVYKKAQWIKPTLYDGSVISSQHVASPVIDDEETLILEELQTSHPNTDQSASLLVKIEAPKELPKDSLSNNQNALEILEYFENNDLKAQLQAKDTTILKCSTSTCRSQPIGNKKNDMISQKPSSNRKNKVEARPRKVNKKNRVKEPICDVNVKHTMLNANFQLICVKCKQCMFDANHDVCFLNFVNDVNMCAKSKSKSKKRQQHNIWKPTGKVFIEVGHKWKPTGIRFYIVGNSCPLTRITPTKVVHLTKTTSNSDEIQKPKIKVYSRRPKQVKSVGSSKKVKIVESKIANNSEPTHLWGSNATAVSSSSSLVNDRNDQVAKIMGYGDYQLGNIIISRVYYIEGIGHNLDTNLYTISLDDMLKTSLICLLSKASKTKSWLWHRRLSHLNFACALGKSKKSSHQPKVEDTNQEKLYILCMDLCGPMRVESINRKKYILVIVDDYSRFTWVKFLRSKDEAPETIIECIKNIQVRLNATVRNVRTDNGTEFVNQTLRDFYENAKAINTTCYTQNRSLIRLRYNKTPYELMYDKKPNLSFLHVFGSLCYRTNDSKDLGKLNAKADIGIFVGYAPAKKAFRIYNSRT
ncbi:retrovirus-related pol polyprotein from transposon TNT 1-94 [Tanacetum coccineum]